MNIDNAINYIQNRLRAGAPMGANTKAELQNQLEKAEKYNTGMGLLSIGAGAAGTLGTMIMMKAIALAPVIAVPAYLLSVLNVYLGARTFSDGEQAQVAQDLLSRVKEA